MHGPNSDFVLVALIARNLLDRNDAAWLLWHDRILESSSDRTLAVDVLLLLIVRRTVFVDETVHIGVESLTI